MHRQPSLSACSVKTQLVITGRQVTTLASQVYGCCTASLVFIVAVDLHGSGFHCSSRSVMLPGCSCWSLLASVCSSLITQDVKPRTGPGGAAVDRECSGEGLRDEGVARTREERRRCGGSSVPAPPAGAVQGKGQSAGAGDPSLASSATRCAQPLCHHSPLATTVAKLSDCHVERVSLQT